MLRDLSLESSYRSDKHNLLTDFYLPCLEESVQYNRAVGYFTSGTLSAAAKGLNKFIGRKGYVRLVASPVLTEEDVTAIQMGYKRRDEVISNSLILSLRKGPLVPPTGQRLGFLAWLISEGLLDIKIAVVEAQGGLGTYHEKIGIFRDDQGSQVVFTGSANESLGGFISNFESIDVYRSWIEADAPRVQTKIEDFEALWNDRTPHLCILDFPEAARRELLKFRPSQAPQNDPEEPNGRAISQKVQDQPHFLKIELRPRQREAADAWERANRRGILAMATGTGKTITGLACAVESTPLNFLVIGAPTNEIVQQWVKEISDRTTFHSPLIGAGSAQSWRDPLFRKLRLLNSAQMSHQRLPVVLIGNYGELSKPQVGGLISDAGGLPEGSMLIADEVHATGAFGHRRLLRSDFVYRLGLSATPLRPHDEEGTDIVLEYFGGVIHEFSLKQAIAAGILCEYEYHVYVAALEDEEYGEFQDLTAQLGRLLANKDEEKIARADLLKIRRANILKSASSKFSILDRILDDFPPKQAMVYCADIPQATSSARLLAHRGFRVARYSSDDVDRKRLLAEFSHGRLDALVAIKCLDEGIDIPEANLAIILASDTSERQFIQRRGRVLRAAVKKTSATIVDVLVVPPPTDVSAGVIKSELSRVRHFTRPARNRMSAIITLVRELAPYGISHSDFL